MGLVKCDVEGAELMVLKGGSRMLEEMRPVIVFECSDQLTQSFGYTVFEALQFLVARKYKLGQLSLGNWIATPL